MAEKVLTKEQKYELKKKRKKQFKWLCGIFVCGIVVVGVSLGINQYRYNKDMQMRLSDDRLNYYTTSIKNGEDIGLEDEYYDEMFLTDEDYYDISEEQQCLIEDVASSIESRYRETNEDFGFGESNLVVGYTGVTLGISANIENDVELYVKSLFDIGEEILDYDSNCTITMYSDNSVAVLYPDRKTGDVYSTNDDVATSMRNAMVNNGVEVYEYDKLVTLDEEAVREQMEKHGTIVPYVTDLVLNSLEKSKTIKIVFKHEESIGYEYMNNGDLNIAIDGAIAESGETILEDEPSEEQLASVDENIPIVKLEDLDLKTSTDVYLVDSDYIDYIDMVEEEDLNINTHIKLHPYETLDYFNTDSEIVEQEEQESLEEDDDAESYSCYVCVFGNARMSNDLKYLQDNIKTDRIALSSMAHIFSNSFISPDLSFETTDMLTAIGRNAY